MMKVNFHRHAVKALEKLSTKNKEKIREKVIKFTSSIQWHWNNSFSRVTN